MDDVYEIERPGWIRYRVRAGDLAEAEALVNRIGGVIGTLAIDPSDWRFSDLSRFDRDSVVEIYAEEG
jgi:hypothetical protein